MNIATSNQTDSTHMYLLSSNMNMKYLAMPYPFTSHPCKNKICYIETIPNTDYNSIILTFKNNAYTLCYLSSWFWVILSVPYRKSSERVLRRSLCSNLWSFGKKYFV